MEKLSNSYESLFVVDVANGEEATKATVDKFTALITENSQVIEIAQWGKRRLAYAIDDKNEGYYVVATYKSEPSFPAEFERLCNIDENVMRSMTLRLEYEPVAKAEAATAEQTASADEQ
ncbi:MAG: 30S ribosomal protein S6 [Clostridia bacterium]|nr:30S ribosomal protein S6 [Clostridia bacterium]MEE1115268.1 30S ribosomal protein S6 [Clostridia bacterium]